jgi:hypothetical protein
METRISNMMVREFFILRFRRMPESDQSYFNEWCERFSRGEKFAISRMDSDSRKAWGKVKKAWKEGRY